MSEAHCEKCLTFKTVLKHLLLKKLEVWQVWALLVPRGRAEVFKHFGAGTWPHFKAPRPRRALHTLGCPWA